MDADAKGSATPRRKKPRVPSRQAAPQRGAAELDISALERRQADAVEEPTSTPGIVGIGASAGGLEALRTFVAHLPVQSTLAYVIAQHLSPTHQSMLVPLLARETRLQVQEVRDGERPRANVVYITPAGWNIALRDHTLHLTAATAPGTPKPSVDQFFASLAEDLGEAALAVVLSGTGSDGARGMRAIRAAGGSTFAQDEGSAKYNGMPRAAVESGCVDYVLPPDAIARQLEAVARLAPASDRDLGGDAGADLLERIFKLVHSQTGIDFHHYKETTVGRRIRRRMAATACGTEQDYLALLSRQPEEVQRLSREILISVTSFFRESSAFDALRLVIDEIVSGKPDNDDIRVWIAGCATGEEAYSVAMLFMEAIKRDQRRLRLQVFATDIDAAALARARRGVFPREELVSVPEDHGRGYFTRSGDFVQVTKSLREAVLFSAHDLLRDPPFLRLDLLTCRNVLIYFKPDVQSRMLRSFHGALRSGGRLFLGRSETTHQQDHLFAAIDDQARIFARLDQAATAGAERARSVAPRVRSERPLTRARRPLAERVLQSLHQYLLPAAVVVDEGLNLQHVFGDVTEFVALQPGTPNLNLYSLAAPNLRAEIRSMVMKAQRTPQKPLSHVVLQRANDRAVRIGVAVLPREENEPTLYLVSLQFIDKPRRANGAASAGNSPEYQHQLRALEDQLSATREHLHSVIEELENSNEELQSLNEELSSANEELQSTNEEMETSNEELQSTNEELTTVNEELETKTHELIRLNSDLRNVKDSLRYPLVVLDEFLRVTLYNPPAMRLFDLTPASLGESLFSLPSSLDLGDLRVRLEAVIATGTTYARQFSGDVCHLLQVDPYIDEANHRKGVVLTFVDNTGIKRAEASLERLAAQIEASERFTRSTIDALPMQICVVDDGGAIVTVNRAWDDFINGNAGLQRHCGVGSNYLEVCERARHAGDALAGQFLEGLREVMDGHRETFALEYPCHGPDAMRWFEATCSRFQGDGPRYVVVAHEDITQRKSREHLVDLQARALDSSSNGIVITEARDGNYPLIFVNRAFEDITGYGRDEVLGQDLRFLQGSDTVQPNLTRVRSALLAHHEERTLLRNYRKDGSMFWNELSIYPIVDADDKPRYFVGVQRDLTARVAGEEALRAARERERLALSFAGIGMFSWDVRGGHIDASEIMLRLLGRAGLAGNLEQDSFRGLVHEADRPLFDDAVRLCLAGHESLDIEYCILWSDDSTRWLHTKGDVENGASGLPERMLCLSQDITQRKESDERVRFIAHHDALTGLPNRTLLRDRLQQALNTARRQRTKVAVAFVDLDHFKHINDSLGHHVGDLILQAVGNRLRAITRDSDTICRHSGDEYIVLLPNVHDSGEVAHVAEKIVEALSQPYPVGSDELIVTPSVGLSLYPDDGDTVDTLIRNADAAMYHAKGSGRRTFQFFLPAMNEKEQNRLLVTTELRRALERGELRVHYQPQIAIGDGHLVGIEALVRWQHPERGLVYPAAFIPIAEDYELVMLLGEWVLREACQQAHDWYRRGLPMAPMAVNFSAVQFRQRNIIAKVAQVLSDSGLPAELLEIELTESAIMHSGSDTTEVLDNLRRLGIRLAIDDFGTGYSSLQHLRHFSIDKLKIDRSFIADLPRDDNAAAIVRAMVMLGRSLGLEVVAEGVETRQQWEFLRTLECGSFQGFYQTAPLDAPSFEVMLRGLPPRA
ncbi:MAG: EAL domain-containing protein [Proteobacteria bacterium]|nr:EAL domain-containing protein [Pseudomonadota bacterium]